MSLIQLFILVIVLAVWWRLYRRLQARELTVVEFVEWFLLWVAVAVVAMVPDVTSYLARLVGVGRGVDLVTYLALLLVFYLVFKLFVKLEKIERQFTSLVQKLALREPESDQERSTPPTKL